MDPYCPVFPASGVVLGSNGADSKDPTIGSPVRSRTDLSTILNQITTSVHADLLRWGGGADPLITAAVVILFARLWCRLSSYRSVSSTISSERISYTQRQCNMGDQNGCD